VDVRCQPETDADKSEYVGESVGDEQAVSFVVVAVYSVVSLTVVLAMSLYESAHMRVE
jgi:hypothetical protein